MAESAQQLVRLTRFGGNRSLWNEFKLRFIGLLVSSNIRFVLTTAKPASDDAAIERWVNANTSLYYKLVEYTCGEPFVLVQSVEDEDGVKAWNLLLNRFERRSAADTVTLLSKFLDTPWADYEPPTSFFTRLEDTRREIHAQGTPTNPVDKLTDSFMAATVVRKLPTPYSALKASIIKDNTMSYNNLKEEIIRFYQLSPEIFNSPSTVNSLAMAARPSALLSRDQCRNCLGHDHWASECPHPPRHQSADPKGPTTFNNRGQGSGRGGGASRGSGGSGGGAGPRKATKDDICHWCGRRGHFVRECRQKQAGKPKTYRPQQSSNSAHVASTASRPGQTAGVPISGPATAPQSSVHTAGAAACGLRNVACTVSATALQAASHGLTKDTWIVDSGCTAHIRSSATGMHDITWLPAGKHTVTVGGGATLPVIGCGKLDAFARSSRGQQLGLTLQRVLIVPDMGKNLFSIRQFKEHGGHAEFTAQGDTLRLSTGDHLPLRMCEQFYVLDLAPQRSGTRAPSGTVAAPVHAAEASLTSSQHPIIALPCHALAAAADASLWHRRLGHRNDADLRKLAKLDVGIPSDIKGAGPCDVCEVSKHTHASFPDKADNHTTARLQLIHSDLLAPGVPNLTGKEYASTFTDDHTRYSWIYFLHKKSDTLSAFKQFVADVKPYGAVKSLRSDKGGEYVGGDFAQFCKSAGILQQFSAPYSPQQNGIAERGMRTLGDMCRCMLEDADLPNTLWSEAMRTAIYLKNRTPHSALDGDTPYFSFHGRQADLSHLRVFGCKAFVQYEERARSKLDRKAWEGVLVGYSDNSKAYRILDPATRKVHESIHVTFREYRSEPAIASVPAPAAISDLPQASPSVGAIQQPVGVLPPPIAIGNSETAPTSSPLTASPTGQPSQLRRSTRERRHNCPDATCPLIPTLGPNHAAHLVEQSVINLGITAQFALYSAADPVLTADPTSYHEAMSAPDAQQWKAAMKSEIDSLVGADTWKAEIIPQGTPLVDSKWVFKRKLGPDGSVARHKARLVARGFSQVPGRDYLDTYAPVARTASIRTIIAAAAARGWDIHQMDVDTAYLNAPLEETIYLRPPKGEPSTDAQGRAIGYRLLKSLYGLKQSARNWHQTVDQWLRSQMLTPSPADPCIYMRTSDDGEPLLAIALYVDDILITGPDTSTITQFKSAISNRFKMKDMGELGFLLGMQAIRNRTMGTIELRQSAYIEQILERFGMADCKPVSTPSESVLADHDIPIHDSAATDALVSTPVGKPDKEYQALVGALLYLAICTRPDIAFAVQQLSRHLQYTTESHWVAGKRVLRYLQGTKALGIVFGATIRDTLVPVGYSDSDWGGSIPNRRSTTGYVFMLAGGPITWSSRLQPTVALSSAEAEYMAVRAASQEAVWLRYLLASLAMPIAGPITIWEDNQGCIALADNPVFHARTKHIAIQYHFTRELVAAGIVALKYIKTADNLADLLTKPLAAPRARQITSQILGTAP